MNTTINIGDRFGHLTIINKDTRPLHRASWLCRCDCGRELYVITSDLLRGIKSCGCSHFSDKYAPIDLTGKRFGHLTVISRHESSRNNTKWLCHCDCGNDVYIYTNALIHGKRKSCGCKTGTTEIKDLNLIGQRFGYLTVIERDSRPCRTSSWLCRCDCGKEVYLLTSDLKGGVKSCGCSQRTRKYNLLDLTGKRFGHLTAIVRQNPATHKAIWLCLCDCGNEINTSVSALISGKRRSCGCVDGTNRLKELNLIGKRFGYLTVIARNTQPLARSSWLCRCDCGNTLTIRTSHLLTGRTKSCGCLTGKPSYTIDLTCKRFGLLTVISRHPSTKSPHTWVCHCDCGNTVNISTSNLLSGHNKSCGCITRKIKEAYSQDLTGMRFYHLTVLSRSLNPQHKSRWLCLCDCGNSCEFTTSDILKGKVSSCGCRKHTLDDSFVDLTGKRFGHLNVISYSIDFNNRVIWHCFCDCGNDVFLSANRLLKKGQTHCGPNCKYLPLQKKERMLGKRYNHLTVKRILEIEPKQYKLLCLCDCGDYTLATPYQLTSGSKRSCGCDLKKYKLSP